MSKEKEEQQELVQLQGPGTYWPLCRIGDIAVIYIFMTVCAICLTLIALLLIFSYVTLPLLVG